jgi:periplasmic divalent cation tolerance protein
VIHERLAACVNVVGNLTSVYRWSEPGEEERVMSDPETLLVIKTTEPLVDALKSRIVQAHPYQVPEFIALSATAVSDAYAQWVINSVAHPKPPS